MLNDLRFAFHQLLKDTGFSALAVLTLALGIGANTAIFSVINGTLLKPLPYDRPGQLVMVWEDPQGDGTGKNGAGGGVFLDWEEQSRSFEALSVIYGLGTAMNLMGGDQPERLHGWQVSRVSCEFFACRRFWVAGLHRRQISSATTIRSW